MLRWGEMRKKERKRIDLKKEKELPSTNNDKEGKTKKKNSEVGGINKEDNNIRST